MACNCLLFHFTFPHWVRNSRSSWVLWPRGIHSRRFLTLPTGHFCISSAGITAQVDEVSLLTSPGKWWCLLVLRNKDCWGKGWGEGAKGRSIGWVLEKSYCCLFTKYCCTVCSLRAFTCNWMRADVFIRRHSHSDRTSWWKPTFGSWDLARLPFLFTELCRLYQVTLAGILCSPKKKKQFLVQNF